MTMKWNNRNNRFDPNGGNGSGSFQEHNELMTELRKSHADVAMVNGPRLDESTFLESLLFLRVNYVVETGGSVLPDDITDQSALTPLRRVARYKLSQN